MSVITRTILARHRWPGQVRRPARTWVIHDMEAPERANIAEGVGNYFRTTTRVASTHYGVDNDSVVRYAYDGDRIAGAYGLNRDSIHVEHAGYARQTRSEWLDPYGVAMLDLSARLFVEVGVNKYKIPVRLLTPKQTADGRSRGVTSHWRSTKGWGVRGGHTDPGANFPWDYWFERVDLHIKSNGLAVPKPQPIVAERVLKQPMRGAEVAEWQEKLNKVLFYKISVDGVFGTKTHTATVVFQKDARIAVDGIVGPQTRGAMEDYLKDGKKVQFKLGPLKINKSPKKAAVPFPGEELKMGDHGADVRRIQQWLRDRKYTIAVDGWFGPQTDNRVRLWQGSNGIRKNGVVDKRTWDSLAKNAAS